MLGLTRALGCERPSGRHFPVGNGRGGFIGSRLSACPPPRHLFVDFKFRWWFPSARAPRASERVQNKTVVKRSYAATFPACRVHAAPPARNWF